MKKDTLKIKELLQLGLKLDELTPAEVISKILDLVQVDSFYESYSDAQSYWIKTEYIELGLTFYKKDSVIIYKNLWLNSTEEDKRDNPEFNFSFNINENEFKQIQKFKKAYQSQLPGNPPIRRGGNILDL